MNFERFVNPFSLSRFKNNDLRLLYKKFNNIKKCKTGKVKSPVFVVGSPRSGTTVLGKCLSAHPKIGGGEESLFLLLFWCLYVDLYKGQNMIGWAPLSQYASNAEILNYMKNFTDNMFSSALNKQDKKIYVDGTPWYSMIAPFINILYPDALFIHIIRDGRRVVESLFQSYEKGFMWAGADIGERTKLWVNLIKHSLEIKKHFPNRYLEVRYEDFYSKPIITLERIAEFLDLEFDKKMTEPLTKGYASPSNSTLVIKQRDPILTDRSITRPINNGWPLDWSKNDKENFLKIGGAIMNKYYSKYLE